ncbi:MAG: hypothetical protein EXR36_02695 [Betaproteobacteria bacterium]|nr:hypothetical protein [Betaproteobacteria bacterium]
MRFLRVVGAQWSWQDQGEGSALELDSLDSLQAAVAISKRFGVRIRDSKDARRVMRRATSLAQFVREQKR